MNMKGWFQFSEERKPRMRRVFEMRDGLVSCALTLCVERE